LFSGTAKRSTFPAGEASSFAKRERYNGRRDSNVVYQSRPPLHNQYLYRRRAQRHTGDPPLNLLSNPRSIKLPFGIFKTNGIRSDNSFCAGFSLKPTVILDIPESRTSRRRGELLSGALKTGVGIVRGEATLRGNELRVSSMCQPAVDIGELSPPPDTEVSIYNRETASLNRIRRDGRKTRMATKSQSTTRCQAAH
jgi:hypothetical protein